MSTAVMVRVTGRVLGVAFGWYAVLVAERLGVRGWVRNEPDESVAAHLEGDDQAVEAMVDWCRRGPSSAVVRDVAVTAARPTGASSFDIRY
jgi:acylphosphatase